MGTIEVTDRDVEIFRFAHEQRYILYNQLRDAFWPERSKKAKACWNRVEQLVQAGYLRKQKSERRKNLNLYFATEKSHEVLKERGFESGIPLYVPTKGFEFHLDHDLKVTNIRVLFRELGLASWTSERVIRERDHLKRIPDGVLNVEGKKIAIEFENYLTKGMKRYEQMYNYYDRHKEYFLVLMVVDANLKDWLIRLLKYDCEQVWFVTYKDLFKCRDKVLFENAAGKFELRQIL